MRITCYTTGRQTATEKLTVHTDGSGGGWIIYAANHSSTNCDHRRDEGHRYREEMTDVKSEEEKQRQVKREEKEEV